MLGSYFAAAIWLVFDRMANHNMVSHEVKTRTLAAAKCILPLLNTFWCGKNGFLCLAQNIFAVISNRPISRHKTSIEIKLKKTYFTAEEQPSNYQLVLSKHTHPDLLERFI